MCCAKSVVFYRMDFPVRSFLHFTLPFFIEFYRMAMRGGRVVSNGQSRSDGQSDGQSRSSCNDSSSNNWRGGRKWTCSKR